MATSPVTLDFSKAQPISLDFSKAQPLENAEPNWWDKVKGILAPGLQASPQSLHQDVSTFEAGAEKQRNAPTWQKTLDVASLASGPLLGKAMEAIPSAARAGRAFEAVKGAAGTLPIDANAAGNVALEAQKLAQSGGRMPKVLLDFLRRATDPEKAEVTFNEARDFYSNASRLSADELNRLSPVMKRQLGMFTAKLGEALEETAGQAGKLDEYLGAMKEYRSAAQLKDISKAVATKYIPRGVGAYVIYKLLGIKP